MAQNKKTRITSEQRQNMQFSEERFQLFESIQEMIENEIKKRGLNKYQILQPKLAANPPPMKNETLHNCLCAWIKRWWKLLFRDKA